MENNYLWSFTKIRNKAGKKGWGVSSIKKKIIVRDGLSCCECKKEFYMGKLHLEHFIPIAIAGDIFNLNNLQLMCRKCHNEKTQIDLKIIRAMKSLKILLPCSILTVHPNTVRKIYLDLYGLTLITSRKNKEYYLHSNYHIVNYKTNREVDDEIFR